MTLFPIVGVLQMLKGRSSSKDGNLQSVLTLKAYWKPSVAKDTWAFFGLTLFVSIRDIQEKNRLVKVMGENYSNAKSVRVWLGQSLSCVSD